MQEILRLAKNARLRMTAVESNTPPDCKALDDVVFDVLGFTAAEWDEAYWAMHALSLSKGASWCNIA
ncbi:hypothetical protein A2V82_02135 [candidate division KSB1 bacterium RBG_16_48_16]|nr:MAG: hypothetical protein A2V82_02135 [candidate division KSB1 bacterium RBG_16_48_16]